jgi:superfamily II DNA or RNA helicase
MWPLEFKRRFGLVIYDECHHMAAPVFVLSADMFYGKRLSLTATAARTDGLEAIYQYHLGRILHKNLSQDLIPHTIFHVLQWEMPPEHKKLVTDRVGDVSTPRVRTYLGGLEWRNNLIYEHLLQDLAEGRHILVLSHSVAHVGRLHDYLSAAGAGMITGDTLQEVRMAILKNGNPVFGTFQLAREGLNKPSLDTLYIVTPFSNSNDLQQAWGRIQRKFAGKQAPLVRVFEDAAFSCCVKSCRALKAVLKKFGYPHSQQEWEKYG